MESRHAEGKAGAVSGILPACMAGRLVAAAGGGPLLVDPILRIQNQAVRTSSFGAHVRRVERATANVQSRPDKSLIPTQVPTRGRSARWMPTARAAQRLYLRLAGEAGRVLRGEAPLGPPADFAVGDPKTFPRTRSRSPPAPEKQTRGDREEGRRLGRRRGTGTGTGGQNAMSEWEKASTRCRVSLSPRPLVLTLLMTLDIVHLGPDRHGQGAPACDFRRNRRPRTAEASLTRRHVCFASVA